MHTKLKISQLAAGVAANVLCSLLFLASAERLTEISPLSTYVLSWTPLIQGALIAIPAAQAFKTIRKNRALATGLIIGIAMQLVCFYFWCERWLQEYAG